MSETSKTVAFIITASILGIAAASSYWMTKPVEVMGFERVGQEFFPDFQDAMEAKSLEVTAYDVESDGLREFSVEMKDGLWRIPSHHNYPAEAADRLARTATSLIGLKRESIVARRNNKHEVYGVVDPADTEADPETAGKRITLRNESGEIVADYIIGKPAGSVADDNSKMVREIDRQDDYYYVRVPEEKETYKAKVQIDLSTRFTDWINPDLLKIEAADINRLEIDNYELIEQNVPVGNNRIQAQVNKNVIDRQKLTRDGFAPWQLEGLNEETEELETLKVEEITTLLDSMKISGVRPKLKLNDQLLVKSDLTINEELARQDPQLFQRRVYQLQEDLELKGFTIGASEEDPTNIALLASRGELRAATKNGVLYTLYFGRSVSGDMAEIEIGGAINPQDEVADTGSEVEADSDSENPKSDSQDESLAESATGSDDESSGENKSRYVAIRVDFDPTALGDPPVEPTEPGKPEKPEGYDTWKEKREKMLLDLGKDAPPDRDEESADDEKTVDDRKSAESDENSDQSPDPPADIAAANDEEFLKYEAAMAEYEKADIQYATDLEMYETEKAAYETREKSGRELVEELNERFAEWFYVVPAESLATLKLTRGDLVKIKETSPPNLDSPTSPGDLDMPARRLPLAPNIEFKSDSQADSSEKSKDHGEPAKESGDESANESGDGAAKESGDG